MSQATAAALILAGALGSLLRYLATTLLPSRSEISAGVLLVNVVGSAAAGALLGVGDAAAIGTDLRLILITGFCGGLTTFSTWTVETADRALARRWRASLLNAAANLVLGFGAAGLAYWLTAMVLQAS